MTNANHKEQNQISTFIKEWWQPISILCGGLALFMSLNVKFTLMLEDMKTIKQQNAQLMPLKVVVDDLKVAMQDMKEWQKQNDKDKQDILTKTAILEYRVNQIK